MLIKLNIENIKYILKKIINKVINNEIIIIY